MKSIDGMAAVEKIEYGGWKNCYRVSNDSVEIIVTGDVGPRILRYGFIGRQNLFKEFQDQIGKTGESHFKARGGHRLWRAPEDLASTWVPDNVSVEISVKPSGVAALAPVERMSGLRKEIEVELAPSGSEVIAVHRIRNCSEKPLTFAPWALTMMAPGGVAVAGFPPRAAYPGKLDPTNPLVMWAYTDLSDKRLTLTRKYLVLRQDMNNPSPQKLGLFNEDTWACYLLNGDLFVKRAQSNPSEAYPDLGCSFEMFTNNEFLELETLGPLRGVLPGESVEHTERWNLHRNVNLSGFTDDAIDSSILPLIGGGK
ncbi:MAG: hypothetical protein WBD10_03290 [Acidobacteriaceae bacterium]